MNSTTVSIITIILVNVVSTDIKLVDRKEPSFRDKNINIYKCVKIRSFNNSLLVRPLRVFRWKS